MNLYSIYMLHYLDLFFGVLRLAPNCNALEHALGLQIACVR
jgi:hypothetical protein